MNVTKIFQYNKNDIRTFKKNEEIWFVGRDVAKVLDYVDTDKAVRNHIEDEDKILDQKFSNNPAISAGFFFALSDFGWGCSSDQTLRCNRRPGG